ncbi:hypothetical protein [Streptomyces sp. NPDC056061]|uniref:hypothetical protein n=1 Tax=Streptomyces sp. NPDC056061 TaxID=3345700 RepID=UPI0035E2A16D
MGFMGETWLVRREQELVGEISVDETDFPWLSGRFAPGPAFAVVQPLFARDLELMEFNDDEHWDEWEKVYDEIRQAVSLTSPSGPVPEFLLHIDGDRAWFRWSDTPFESND